MKDAYLAMVQAKEDARALLQMMGIDDRSASLEGEAKGIHGNEAYLWSAYVAARNRVKSIRAQLRQRDWAT